MKYRMTYTISSPVKGEGAVQSSGKLPNIILLTPTPGFNEAPKIGKRACAGVF